LIPIHRLKNFVDINNFKLFNIHYSTYSGLGKSYLIHQKCIKNKLEVIEIPIYGETNLFDLISNIKRKILNKTKYSIHLNLH
jgi:hypothetical protein